MGDGRTYWLGRYEVEIERMDGNRVRFVYLNPSPTMSRDVDGKVRGTLPWPAFAIQNKPGRRG